MAPAVSSIYGGLAWSSRPTCHNVPLHISLGTAAVTAAPHGLWPVQLPTHQQQRRHHRIIAVAATESRAVPDGAPKRVRRTPASVQQQSNGRSSRRQAPADMDVDDLFLDPQEAAKLRRMVKSKGLDAVVDNQGIVKVPLSDDAGAATASTRAAKRSRSHGFAAEYEQEDSEDIADVDAAGFDDDTVDSSDSEQSSRDSSGSSSSSSRGRLFSQSQLKPAVPGSGGTAPVLPIVRPSSSSSDEDSSSSSSRSSRGRPGGAPLWASRSRRPGGPTAAAAAAAAGASQTAAFFSSKSWEDVRALPEIIEALSSLGIRKPSHVQAEAFKALSPKSGFKHVAIADQAGSGKTLAYLLPLLQQLKQKEAKLGGPATQPNSPSIIVMAPTTELAQQVGRVVRALSGAGLRVRSTVMTGGQAEADRRSKTFRTQCELLEGGVDVLVATPGRLLSHLDKGSLCLQHTDALVMDEVDVLAGGEVSYAEHIAPLRAAGGADMRCVLVSATLPQHTFDELQELFVGLGAAFGPGLHRTATGCIEELVDCSGGDDISLESGTQRKLDALMEALDRVKSPRTLVFCNKIETCRVVENALNRRLPRAAQVLAYHEAIREETRAAALASWLSAPTPSQPPIVLVCTDRTSRGIDSMWCEHVVLFEFPRDPSEYVRRVGRTARGAGGKGVVTVLVLGKQVALAKDILARNKAGAPVHKVPKLWNDALQ